MEHVKDIIRERVAETTTAERAAVRSQADSDDNAREDDTPNIVVDIADNEADDETDVPENVLVCTVYVSRNDISHETSAIQWPVDRQTLARRSNLFTVQEWFPDGCWIWVDSLHRQQHTQDDRLSKDVAKFLRHKAHFMLADAAVSMRDIDRFFYAGARGKEISAIKFPYDFIQTVRATPQGESHSFLGTEPV